MLSAQRSRSLTPPHGMVMDFHCISMLFLHFSYIPLVFLAFGCNSLHDSPCCPAVKVNTLPGSAVKINTSACSAVKINTSACSAIRVNTSACSAIKVNTLKCLAVKVSHHAQRPAVKINTCSALDTAAPSGCRASIVVEFDLKVQLFQHLLTY